MSEEERLTVKTVVDCAVSSNTYYDMPDYISMVDKSARDKENSIIKNRLPVHASYLISKLFSIAQKRVMLYSDSLTHTLESVDNNGNKINVDLYGGNSVIDNIEIFLMNKGVSLEIVVENTVNKLNSHPIVQLVKKMRAKETLNGVFFIGQLSADALITLEKSKFDTHFMVVDESAYRVEIEPNKQSYRAEANFGDFDKTLLYTNAFDNFFVPNSTEIDIS